MDMNKDVDTFFNAVDNGINNNKLEFVSGSNENEILKQVQSDKVSLCNPELASETMMKKSFAFTLTESLIMVAIVGVIATITMVSLSGLKPNKDKMLLQKAYRSTLSIVSELTNDTVAYPPLSSASIEYIFSLPKQIMFAASGLPDLNGPTQTTAITEDPWSCELPGPNTGFPNKTNIDLTGKFTGTIGCNTDITPGGTDTPDDGTGISTATGSGAPAGGGNSGVASNDGSSRDYFLPDIGSSSSSSTTSAAGQLTVTPASATLTNRDVPSRDSGKYSSENKFAYMFADRMVAQAASASTSKFTCTKNVCTFITPDGMNWIVTDNFKAGDTSSTATIQVDINGSKGPNKPYNSSNPTSVKTPDQFTFVVRASGQVVVQSDDAVAVKYLQSRDNK